MPSVSYLVTVFNGGACLARALESIERQTDMPEQVVVVDDGSDDDSIDVAMRFAGRLPLDVVAEKRIGRGAALNVGIKRCVTELVSILDADDWAFPHRTARQRQQFADDRLGVGGSSFVQITAGPSFDGPELRLRRLPLEDHQIRRALAYSGPFCHSTVTYRRAAVEDVGGFDPALRSQIDQDLWVRIAAAGWLMQNEPMPVAAHYKAPDTYFARLNTRGNRARTMFARNLDACRRLDLPTVFYAAALGRIAVNALPIIGIGRLLGRNVDQWDGLELTESELNELRERYG